VPVGWKPNIVRGRGYDLETDPGRSLFLAVEAALAQRGLNEPWPPALRDAPPVGEDRYGKPTLVRPRLGQGAFRVLVTDAYGRRCGVTGERVLPVLEVSRRIREEFENGRDYYALHGRDLRPPATFDHRPDAQSLGWHNEQVFRG
jgi:putative restriction endonuclease